MSRFQLSLNVSDVDESAAFYTALLGVEPAKRRDGYVNFVVDEPPLKLVLIEDEGTPGSINHVGIELADAETVVAETRRVEALGLPVEVDEVHTCCFASQQKAWSMDPDRVPWELYTVLEDTEHFGANPHGTTPVDTILPPVDRATLQAALAGEDTIVIDAQGDGGYARAHIPGSVDIDIHAVVEQAARVIPTKDHPVILSCTDLACSGSEFVGTILVEAGYTAVRRFPGGVAEWAEAGLPVESTAGMSEPA